jgi:hypothetical protein
MRIPTKFLNSLEDAYTNSRKIDNIFIDNQKFLMNMAGYYYKCIHRSSKTSMCIDDLYQVMCMKIIDCMWDYDETKNRTLGYYVMYNVGVELQHIVRASYTQKRRANVESFEDHINPEFENWFMEKNPGLNFEEQYDLKHLYEEIKNDSPLDAKIVELLIKYEGNVKGVATEIKEKNLVRGYEKKSVDSIRIALAKKFIPKIRSRFKTLGMIPVDTSKHV